MWDTLVQSKSNIYHHLVCICYANLTYNPFSVETLIKGVKIILDPQTLGTILGISSTGDYISAHNIQTNSPISTKVLCNIFGNRLTIPTLL